MNGKNNLLLLLLLIGLFISGCSDDNTSTQEAKANVDVVLRVYGTTSEANVSYTCFNDPPLAGDFIVLPWGLELSCDAQSGEAIRIFAIPREDPGSLICEIYIDGEMVASDTMEQDGTQRVKCEYIP